MPTTYSTTPYFDDYDEDKQFYRILFRPGRAVQARELTQLQTLLQAQIERFGKGIYKEGSFVTPPKETFDPNFSFVKLQTTHNSVEADGVIDDLVGQIVVGQTSGVRATVVNHTVSTVGGDPPTIYVKYLNSGTTGTTETFVDNEIITNVASTISVRAISSSATGNGTAFSVGTSVIFAKGNFLYVEQQTKIIEKYTSVSNRIIGFLITESRISSDDDESLLDPAIDTFNYFAPGADRYKIALTLEDRSFAISANDDPNFIELIRIENGAIISKSLDPRFSILGDTLARRTFEESGNYEVTPYNLELFEHLRANAISNALADVTITRDGIFTAANGGDESLFVVHVLPGKAYVKGYEVDDNLTTYINIPKARDFANVNSGTVATQLCSYIDIDNVYSLPALSDIPTVNFYDKYTATHGTASGVQTGTAKVRNIEYVSGNAQIQQAAFKLYLFDIQMDSGYSFERNAKQVYIDNVGYVDFTANITPTFVTLSGTASFLNGNPTITGVGTRFTQELASGDFITINGNVFLVSTITNDQSLEAGSNAVGNSTGFPLLLNTAKVNDADKDSFIVPFPFEVIKTVDPTNVETDYTVKRFYSRTLSGGNVTITAGTNETFTAYANEDYQVLIASGGRAGNILTLDSTQFVRGGAPTGSTLDVVLVNEGLTTETVKILTTVRKTNSAAVKKSKTLVAGSTLDKTAKADAQATTISLGKADGFKLNSVRMSNVAFGASYVEAGSVDITSRYTFDNGQKETFYDLAKIVLKPGAAKPTNPIRINFDFFTHGTGDYFSVDSYSGINYKQIPTVTIGTTTYKLRDSLDFRPRINDAGTGFTGTGASTTEFLDPEIDYQTDYQYFLPRIDNISMDENGLFYVTRGISSLAPTEPKPPSDLLSLFVLRQQPYVFSLGEDIDVIRVENKRYTMKDIGKIENRVKTLEYYTSLSLLERDAQQEQIQDELGFERFKNGFLVDSFTGHGVGDTNNEDYSVSVNFKNKEASPLVVNQFVNLDEVATTAAERTSNNYILNSDLITLPYTETTFIENRYSSTSENLNPFNIVVFNGFIKLDPPGDLWFDDTRVPEIVVDQTGAYESLRSASLVKKDGRNIFGSINDIEQLRGGMPPNLTDLPDNLKGLADIIGAVSPATSTLTLSGKEIIKNTTVIPKMRDVTINFVAQGLRPNTRFFAYFDELNVTNYCTIKTNAFNEASANIHNNAFTTFSDFESKITTLANASSNSSFTPLITDATGTLKGRFVYSSGSLNLTTGVKTFRLTNSRNNNKQTEGSFAEAVFFSDGLQREIADEILRPPPPPPPPPDPPPPVVEVFYNDPSPPQPDPVVVGPTPVTPPPIVKDRLTKIYEMVRGTPPDPGGYDYWSGPEGFNTANPTDTQLRARKDMMDIFRADSNTGKAGGPLQSTIAKVIDLSATASQQSGLTVADTLQKSVLIDDITEDQANEIMIGTVKLLT